MGQVTASEQVKQPDNSQLNLLLKAYLKDFISFVISPSMEINNRAVDLHS